MKIRTARQCIPLVAALTLLAACNSNPASNVAADAPEQSTIVQGEPQNATAVPEECVPMSGYPFRQCVDALTPDGEEVENTSDRILVMPMMLTPTEPIYPPDPPLDLPADTADPDSGFEVLVPRSATQDAVDRQLRAAYDDWLASSRGEAYITGNCGYSYVLLYRTTYNGYDAIHSGGFEINRPGYAYRLNVRTWDPDLNTFNFNTPETGNLYGGRGEDVGDAFSVPQSDNYRAQLNRGDVYVGGNSWCTTGQPQTTEYLRR